MKMSCPICKNRNINQKIQQASFTIYQCSNCSFEFLDLKNKSAIKKIYNKNYFHGKLSGVKGYTDYNLLEKDLIRESLAKLTIIKKHSDFKSLLDLGAGTGVFLTEAKKQGYNIFGNDISSYAVKKLRAKKIKAYLGSIENNILPKAEFDIVTAWDVLEHIPNLTKALNSIHNSLKPGGLLFITTPDTGSIDARLLGKNWYGYKKIPEHICFFNKRSLSLLLSSSNFEVISYEKWGFYRSLDFILEKLQNYSNFFKIVRNFIHLTPIKNFSFFFPFTDSLIVAKKNE